MLNDLAVYCNDMTNFKKGFQQADWDILTNPKSVAKIHQQFSRTPFKFNLYVFFDSENRGREFKPYVSDKPFAPNAKVLDQALSRGGEHTDCITVCYANNYTAPSNYYPLTAWMLAHRMHHALMANKSKLNSHCMNFESLTNQLLAELQHNMVTPKGHLSFKLALGNLLLTTRAARNKRIDNILDVSAEIMAQYIITGKIKLARVQDWDVNYPMYPDEGYFMNRNRQPVQFHEILNDSNELLMNSRIEYYEQQINHACEQSLTSLVGKVLHW